MGRLVLKDFVPGNVGIRVEPGEVILSDRSSGGALETRVRSVVRAEVSIGEGK